jgi:hypothetical protein
VSGGGGAVTVMLASDVCWLLLCRGVRFDVIMCFGFVTQDARAFNDVLLARVLRTCLTGACFTG